MIIPRSSTETLITALRVLARDIQSDDGVANAAIAEAADRMEEMQRQLERVPAEEAELTSGDLFWSDEGEEGYTDAFEALEGALDGTQGAFIERIQRSKRLPDTFAVGELTEDGFEDVKFFATADEAKVEFLARNLQSGLGL